MKVCGKCRTLKDESEFSKNKRKPDGLQSSCKECQKKRNNEYYAKSEVRREAIRRNRQPVTEYNSKLVKRHKRFCGCKICAEREPCVLDYHHVDSSTKDLEVATLIKYSTKRLRVEIRKCVVLCSNCHRKVHSGILVV